MRRWSTSGFRHLAEGVPVEQGLSLGNEHLAILRGFRLTRAWRARLNIVCCIDFERDRGRANQYLEELREVCRIPRGAASLVMVGKVTDCLYRAPQSDMDVLGLRNVPADVAFVRRAIVASRSACLFTQDSGHESALV